MENGCGEDVGMKLQLFTAPSPRLFRDIFWLQPPRLRTPPAYFLCNVCANLPIHPFGSTTPMLIVVLTRFLCLWLLLLCPFECSPLPSLPQRPREGDAGAQKVPRARAGAPQRPDGDDRHHVPVRAERARGRGQPRSSLGTVLRRWLIKGEREGNCWRWRCFVS